MAGGRTLHARVLGPYAYRPVPLLQALGVFPPVGGLPGAGEAPADPGGLAVLLDSPGGSPRLARRSLLAWRPEAHLWAKDGRVVVTRREEFPGGAPGVEGGAGLEADAADPHSRAADPHSRAADPHSRAADPGKSELGLGVGGAAMPSAAGWTRAESRGDLFLALRALLAEYAGPIAWWGPEGDDLGWVGAYGLVSYDAGRAIEVLPDTTLDDLHIPDLDVIFPTRWLCFDHERERVTAVADAPEALEEMERLVSRAAQAPRVPLDLEVAGYSREESLRTVSNMTRKEYEGIVARGREYVWAGDVFQTNLSQRLELPYAGDSALLYRVLRALNPSPFAGYLRLSGYELFSSSPERLVRLRGRVADTRPIAGTRRRGRDFTEDGLLAEDLNLDPKERAEHVMLVDLERNDLGRVCEYGSVHVDELMVNERYSHVIHIVSNVTGTLRQDKDAVDLLRAMFPGGTITGCPKVRCMEIIDELETVRRGPYTGSFGFFGYSGDMDVNIVIRTLVRVGGRLYAQAGAGIVADSVPKKEYLETLSKAEAMVRAARAAARLAEGEPESGGSVS